MGIVIIFILILINGLFAMSEIAIISARKSRLQHLANEGNKQALAALELAKSPNKFLSTAQIGITFVGIFTGAFGGQTLAKSLAIYIKLVPFIGNYSEPISFFLVISIITFISLIFGELVPKRLALQNPEMIAKLVAGPMNILSSISSPFVRILGLSTDLVLNIIGMSSLTETQITEDEVKMLITEGTKAGVFEIVEKDIVERTLRLGDKKINTIMTPRTEIIWLDIDSSFKILRSKIAKHTHSYFPVCRDSLDKVVGIVRAENLFTKFLVDETINLVDSLHKPLFIPETMKALKVLEMFKKSRTHIALIVDKYGSIQGIVSLSDILDEIVGDIPIAADLKEKDIVKQKDGSFLVDGLVTIEEFKEYFHIKKIQGEKSGMFHTIGGFTMSKLNRIPTPGDSFEWDLFRFEVVNMDGNRINEVLVFYNKQNNSSN